MLEPHTTKAARFWQHRDTDQDDRDEPHPQRRDVPLMLLKKW